MIKRGSEATSSSSGELRSIERGSEATSGPSGELWS